MAIHIAKKPGYLEDDPPAKKEVKMPSEIRKEIAAIPKNPKSAKRKVSVSIRLTPEVVEFFEADGMGWQTRIDAVLLDYVTRNSGGEK